MKLKGKKIAKGTAISCITVSDLDKAKHFFVDILGFEIKDFQEQFQWMEVGGDEGSLIGIGKASKEGEGCGMSAGSNAIISIDVGNLEEAMAHLKKHEIQFIGEVMEVPDQVKMVLFEDFDGNRFFLCETLKNKNL